MLTTKTLTCIYKCILKFLRRKEKPAANFNSSLIHTHYFKAYKASYLTNGYQKMKWERMICGTLGWIFFNLATAVDVGSQAIWFNFAVIGGVIAIALYDRSTPPQNLNPRLLRVFDSIGLVVAIFVAILLRLHKDILLTDRAPLPLFFSVTCTAAGSLFMLSMVRPVSTDFGLLIGLYYLSYIIALDLFGFGFLTFLAAGPLVSVPAIRGQFIIRRRA